MLGVGGRLLTKYEVFLGQGEIKKSLRLKSQARSVMSVILGSRGRRIINLRPACATP